MAKNLQKRSTLSIIFILGPLIFSFALALDIYVSSIPTIQTIFHTNQVMVQLTVSVFLLGTGVGQLFGGPLSDQIGRRRVALVSVSFYLLGSLLCTFAPTITFLIIFRAVQALGACGMMVSAFAIVRDLFSGDDCARIYSFLNSTIALSPLLAPLAGGYLAKWINWRASFAFLSLISFIVLIITYLNINETLKRENRTKMGRHLLDHYLSIARSLKFITYTFCGAAGFAGFLTFFSLSSYIIITLLNVPQEHFGFYFAAIGVVFFFGSLLSGYSSKKIGTYKTVIIGCILMTLSGIVMLYWHLKWGLSIPAFMGPMMIMGIGGSMLMGGGAGGAIEPFPRMAGTASALFGSFEFVFAFAVSTFVLQWQVKSTIPLGLTLLILGFLALLATVCNYKILTKKSPQS